MSDENKKTPNDNDLNDLLDSALKDFDSFDTATKAKSDETSTENQELFNDDFFAAQARLLGERMNTIFNPAGEQNVSPDQMNMGFQKLAEAAAMALQGDIPVNESGTKYADSISEALKGLREGSENLQAPVSEDDVTNMFSNLGLGKEGDTDGNPFLPFMQGMMQSLLSAEILLPSIKELLDKYPKYLEENSNKLSSEDKTRYEKQLELFKILANDLEAEKPDDSDTVKQDRFKNILENMQKLHEYGQPPDELIAEVGVDGLPGLDAMASGGILGGASNNQCPMM